MAGANKPVGTAESPDASGETPANPPARDEPRPNEPRRDEPRPEEPQPDPWSRTLKAVSAVGPPVTIGAALLLYFGWARSNAQAKAMGLDVSLFGYSPQDYMLRSINSLFLPLALLTMVAIGWYVADQLLRAALDAGKAVRLIRGAALAAIVVGTVAAAVLFALVLIRPDAALPLHPYVIALCVLLAAWGLRIHRHARSGESPSPRTRRVMEATFITTLVTLLLFWGTADFAEAMGQRLAAEYERGIETLPRGTIYSPVELSITAPGVVVTSVGTEEKPLFRYTGLRLLVVSGGRVFFLHDGWNLSDGRVIVMPDDENVRYEFQN